MSDNENSQPAPSDNSNKYYAVVLTTAGDLETSGFDTLPELVSFLRSLVDRDVSVSCFMGQRLGISKPPTRCLLTPDGPQPLFDPMTDDLEEDETGYLGVDPIHLEEPPTIDVPRQNTVAPDEFFSDENDAAINIFDSALPDPDA